MTALLVFGETGQVASALRRLAPEALFLGRARADLSDPATCAAAIAQHQPSAVINAAAWTAVDKAETEEAAATVVNGDAPAAMARVCAALDIPFVQISTDYVFDGRGSTPFRETDPTGPLNVYGASKRAGEQALAGIPHLVLRTSWVHAPGHANFIASMLRFATERESLRVVADQVGSPTSADLIAAVTARLVELYAAATPPRSGIYHLAAAGDVSWHGYAVYLVQAARALGHPLRSHPGAIAPIASADFPQAARRPLNSRLDCGKLEALLGAALPDWREGVQATLRDQLGVPA